MPMTEKKRISDARWQKKNFSTLACKVYKGDAEAFVAYATAQGKTVNDILRGYVAECLGRPLERRDKPGAAANEQERD